MRHAIRRAVRSTHDGFASAQNTLLAQVLIAVLLSLIALSGGRHVPSQESVPATFEEWQ